MKKPKNLDPHRLWFGFFGVWALLLTGLLPGMVGGPGMIQAIRLQNLLHAKLTRLEKIQVRVNDLQSEAELLQKSSVIQQREIRRVLGYAAPDELIFDFGSNNNL